MSLVAAGLPYFLAYLMLGGCVAWVAGPELKAAFERNPGPAGAAEQSRAPFCLWGASVLEAA